MKKLVNLSFLALALIGCQKVDSIVDSQNNGLCQIVFKAGYDDVKSPEPISSPEDLDGFYVTAISNSSVEWENAHFVKDSKNPDTYVSGRVWPSTDHKFSFIASNKKVVKQGNSFRVDISSIDLDVICGYISESSYKEVNKFTFSHILCRVSTVDLKALRDLGCTDIKAIINCSVSGSYDILDGKFVSRGTTKDVVLTESDNDLWIIPGSYDLTVSFNDSYGNPHSSTKILAFDAGCVCAIRCDADKPFVVNRYFKYSTPTFVASFPYLVPASGADIGGETEYLPQVVSVAQKYKEVVVYSDGTEVEDTEERNVDFSKSSYSLAYSTENIESSFSSQCPLIKVASLERTEKPKSILDECFYVKLTANGVSSVEKADIWQQENVKTIVPEKTDILKVSISLNPDTVNSDGGSDIVSVTGKYSWKKTSEHAVYTSGCSDDYTTTTGEDNITSGLSLSVKKDTPSTGLTFNGTKISVAAYTDKTNDRSWLIVGKYKDILSDPVKLTQTHSSSWSFDDGDDGDDTDPEEGNL